MTPVETVPGARGTGRRERLRGLLGLMAALPIAGGARIAAATQWAPRFSGVYSDWASAEQAARRASATGYDSEKVAAVSFEIMCRRAPWDYPMLFWLERLGGQGTRVLDAGGHMGTKYIAFSGVLDVRRFDWTVFDLPGIVLAARKRQERHELPERLRFVDRLADAPPCDILIASGLLQYLDTPFAGFVAALAQRPKVVLLNEVALRPDAGVFTVERIGPGRVPYQIRSRTDWDAEVDAMGYDVVDEWPIPQLSHTVPTHPWLPASDSRGCVLICRKARRDIIAGPGQVNRLAPPSQLPTKARQKASHQSGERQCHE
ncbi:methyltransferase, TIGR04325 family (plasmid) [Salipiger sp. H15]|uniref:Methyltransferase, TIGR04325 family n=1 Tax=Alloyangia sp. H15 TaxID=3029062 RepID=A0AAU8ATH2_9RHOB